MTLNDIMNGVVVNVHVLANDVKKIKKKKKNHTSSGGVRKKLDMNQMKCVLFTHSCC